MPATFLSVATALPEHRLDGARALAVLTRLWPRLRHLEQDGAAELSTRYAAEPVERILEARGLSERMASYAEHAGQLAEEAIRLALDRAQVAAADVDLVISVSCTGYLVPSLDAHLAARLGLRPDVLRLPITELGCSGGSAALAFAHRHLAAYPEQTVLVVAVEVPSASFQTGDRTLDNLTASLVFGDGAGAALLTGPSRQPSGLRIESAASRLVPQSTASLGFDLRDGGFHVVLDRRLPRLIEQNLGPAVGEFRERAGLSEVDFYAVHSGGPRILDAVESALGLCPGHLEDSRGVYQRVGNVSSASILFSLESLLSRLDGRSGTGLGIGFGPGVSIELMALRWCP